MTKYVIIFIFIFFFGLFLYQSVVFNDHKLHLTFCNVGQGDAIYIRTPSGRDILFDGGPDDKVLSCLDRSMPLWDRSIDLVLLSHPHADHLNGLVDVFQRYKVRAFATEDLANTSDGYKELQKAVKEEKLAWQTLSDGASVRLADGVSLTVVGPTGEYLAKTALPGKYITSSEFASLEVLLSYKDFDVLLTGDSQAEEMGQMVTSHHLPDIEVLQTPHHGSRTGLNEEIVKRLHPNVAVISVGKNNYGHPTPFTLNLLQKVGAKISRTDREGDVRLISNGGTYSLL